MALPATRGPGASSRSITTKSESICKSLGDDSTRVPPNLMLWSFTRSACSGDDPWKAACLPSRKSLQEAA